MHFRNSFKYCKSSDTFPIKKKKRGPGFLCKHSPVKRETLYSSTFEFPYGSRAGDGILNFDLLVCEVLKTEKFYP